MHHIREMTQGDDPRMEVRFTKSENNFADPMTKNVVEAIFHSLVPLIKDGRIADRIYDAVNREDVGKTGHVHMLEAHVVTMVNGVSTDVGWAESIAEPPTTVGMTVAVHRRGNDSVEDRVND
jgi:hypothetical protein